MASAAGVLTVATVNVNGLRAAFRKGMGPWLSAVQPDVVLLQEVRAPVEIVDGFFPASDGWHVEAWPCEIKGRAGVAIASRFPLSDVRRGLSAHETRSVDSQGGAIDPSLGEPAVDTGRWIEAVVALPCGESLRVVSAYLHSATNTPELAHTLVAKYAHLDKVTARLAELSGGSAGGANAATTGDGGAPSSAEASTPALADPVVGPVLVGGDVNIAHHNADIANWRGNKNSAGFLPEERAYLDRWFAPVAEGGLGWLDCGRHHAGEVAGPYTWWTWRGQAFTKDVGWRIDYLLANPTLAPHLTDMAVHRADTYEARWSDHAPVTATFTF